MVNKVALDEVWGVTTDNGTTFVDQNLNLFNICLWDEHAFYSTKEEAKKFLKNAYNSYDNLKVIKLSFFVKISSR